MERETLAVVHALCVWKLYLYNSLEVLTDNMGVTYIKSKKDLSRREARWMEFLSEFDFTILHRPGANNMADALSRRPDLDLNLLTSISTSDSEENSLTQDYQQDRKAQAIIDRLSRSPTDAFHKQYQWDEASQRLFLRWKDTWRLYIPKGNMRLKLLKEYHDLPSAGHQGRHRTYTRMCRHVYWPGMCMDVQRYVRSCDLCQRMKGGRRNNGLLHPLPVPDRPWQDISMDLITGLPQTANGFDAIFTFVDRLSKSVHLCPTSATIDAAGAANLYIQNVFRLHGLSRSIVCDRDPRFTAEFFEEIFSRLGSKLKFSTANHPQTDGQSERANRVVGDILRSFVNHRQNNWDDCLPFCEFAINDMLQESTKETSFRIVYGWHPTSPADMLNLPQGSVAQPWLECPQEALVIARDCILAAQARQALYADQHRHGEDFHAGEKVLVHRDFLSTDVTRAQPCEKLKPVWVGPFKIARMLSSNAARLELPRNCRAHPVFNVSALR